MISVGASGIIMTSMVMFSLINKFLEYGIIPVPKRYQGKDQHKWRSAATSLLHASLIGILSHISLTTVWTDFVVDYTSIGQATIAIATGYTIYDTLNLVRNAKSSMVSTLIIHHFIVAFFGMEFLQNRSWLGYGLLCASVELNSVFLHSRQLLNMYEVPKTSTIFRLNNMAYIVTFLINRVPAFLMMIYFLIWDMHRMTTLWQMSILPGTVGLLFVNVSLFKKVLSSDYLVQ